MSTKLQTVVSGQLPEFVREDYPVFTEFLEAYYGYLDQQEKRNLTELRDIDQTVDGFIEYFKNELNIFGESAYDHIDNTLLMRKVKQIYTSKGSEPAYKFIFKVLFGKDVKISYPWEQVLKASDGKWKQDHALFIKVKSGDINTLPGNKISIIGPNKIIKVYVERIEPVAGDVYQVFIDRHYYGTIELTDQISFSGFSGELLTTTTGYKIEHAGSGFKVGDIINANTIAGSTIVESVLKVIQVDSNGGIVKLSTIKFGAGYSDEFFVMLNKSATVSNSRLALYKKSGTIDPPDLATLPAQFNIPDQSYLEQYNEYGSILNPNYWETTGELAHTVADPTYVGTVIREFYSQTLNNQSNTDYALVRFYIGPVAKYQGYYITNDGFLDDIIKIQDSYYYQKYSYLITVDEKLEDYSTILKSYLHAAGTKLFSEYQIQNNYVFNISGDLKVDKWQSKATFRTINKSIANEFMGLSDIGGTIRIDPYDAEDYFAITTGGQSFNPPTYQDFTG